jgi:hypothetical protein
LRDNKKYLLQTAKSAFNWPSNHSSFVDTIPEELQETQDIIPRREWSYYTWDAMEPQDRKT